METLSDFGTVSFFSISTLTTAIYNAWIAFDDLASANQLSFVYYCYLFFIFLLKIFLEKELDIIHLQGEDCE